MTVARNPRRSRIRWPGSHPNRGGRSMLLWDDFPGAIFHPGGAAESADIPIESLEPFW